MRSKIVTFLLYLILIALIIGFVILGGMVYLTLNDDTSELTYQLETIAIEESTNKSTEDSSQSVDEEIQNILISIGEDDENTSDETQSVEEDSSINMYFYDQLSDDEKIIYTKLKESKAYLKQGNYTVELGDTFSDLLSEEDGTEQLGKMYQSAVEALLHDNPDLFYIDVNKLYLSIEKTTKMFSTTYNVYIGAADNSTYLSSDYSSALQVDSAIKAIENIRDKVVNQVSGTTYNKIMQIHNYLIDSIEYDSSYSALGTYGLYGALIGKKCVCEGYAKAFKYLCNAIGVECELMQGIATNSVGTTESHAWNCVKIDGIWYGVDVTWDDPIIKGYSSGITNTVRYRYFLKGKTTFDNDHTLEYQFSEGGKYFSYPTLNEEDY